MLVKPTKEITSAFLSETRRIGPSGENSEKQPRVWTFSLTMAGHTPEQQIVTLEEMLPHLRPGGVYLCEDVHGIHHDFAGVRQWAFESSSHSKSDIRAGPRGRAD